MSLWMLILAAAGAAAEDQAKPATVSVDFVIGASTEELAKTLLPPEIAARMKGHKLFPPHLHWLEGYPARFWGEATAIEPGFCQRVTYYVPMPQRIEGMLNPGEPVRGAEVKMAADCSAATEPFISLNRTSPQEAVELLQWLNAAHLQAGGPGELEFDVECRSEQEPNPCAKGARQVLAELPVDQVSIINRAGR